MLASRVILEDHAHLCRQPGGKSLRPSCEVVVPTRPLFSHTCKLLLPQPPSFHILTKLPGGVPLPFAGIRRPRKPLKDNDFRQNRSIRSTARKPLSDHFSTLIWRFSSLPTTPLQGTMYTNSVPEFRHRGRTLPLGGGPLQENQMIRRDFFKKSITLVKSLEALPGVNQLSALLTA
jgi:hypothetical protein